MSRRDEVMLVRKRHEIYVGLTGKDIILTSANPPGRTDTVNYVAVPIEDPDVGAIHAHEWDHIIWKTNLHARQLFVKMYVDELEQRGAVDETSLSFRRRDAEQFVDLVTNALDDIRVTSCRELVWPGEAERINNRWARIVASANSENFVLRLIGLSCRPNDSIISGGGRRFDPHMIDAITQVRRAGYAKVLFATRRLLNACLFEEGMLADTGELPQVPAPPDASTRLSRRSTPHGPPANLTLERIGSRALKAVPKIVDSDAPTGTDPNSTATASMVQAAMGDATIAQMARMFSDGELEVQTMSYALQSKVRPPEMDHVLLKDLPRTAFKDLGPTDVEPFNIIEDDLNLAQHLKRYASSLAEMRRRRRTDEGTEIDVERYVDYLTGGSNEFFMEDTLEKGFSCLMLLDMSGSMLKRWNTLSRANAVITRGLSFPFSKLETWGFSGSSTGETSIYRFRSPMSGIMPNTRQPDMWGLTPLNSAVLVATRRLAQMTGRTKHLFVVTDGHPQSVGTGPAELRQSVRQSVLEARRWNIRVSALIVGDAVSDDHALEMFGAWWQRIDDNQDSLFNEVVQLVRGAFTHYLRK